MMGTNCPKHVEKSNKHIKKICAPSWFYLQKIIQGCWSTKHKIQPRNAVNHNKHDNVPLTSPAPALALIKPTF